jgi:hypothetical protein
VLAVTEGDAAAGEVVGGELDGDAVAGEDADVVLAHLAGEVTEDGVAVFEFDAEHGVGECLGDAAFHRQRVGILATGAFFGWRRGCRWPHGAGWAAVGRFLCHGDSSRSRFDR